MNKIKINFFQARYGDCFLIEFNDTNKTTFLIDGGFSKIFRNNVAEKLMRVYKENSNNYIFLTHIDEDHINGIKTYFECYYERDHNIKKVFFNTFKGLQKFIADEEKLDYIYIDDQSQIMTSAEQGKKLEQHLEECGVKVSGIIETGKRIEIGDIIVTFLSPSQKSLSKYQTWAEEKEIAYTASVENDYSEDLKSLSEKTFSEDTSVTNISSLSFLIEYDGKRMLFSGDAIPSDIVQTLSDMGYSKQNKLKIDVLKVSHHGSRNNTSTELLEMVECKKFLISTDGSRYGHPDKETLARIIYMQDCPELIFNYGIHKRIFTEDELSSEMFTVSVDSEVII